jgi:ABC-type uncharacterized transport system substrate-binding protein
MRSASGPISLAARPANAAEFVRLKVDVIVTSGTPQVLAAKQATSVIPIVFATAGDPVANGLGGGNVIEREIRRCFAERERYGRGVISKV